MSSSRKGKSHAITPARAIVLELLHHAQKVPTVPNSKVIRVADLMAARKQADLSWIVLFMKAHALVSLEIPQLRQVYMPYPWPRIYEHPESVAAVVVEREENDERMTLGARLRSPETRELGNLQFQLNKFRTFPLQKVRHFRQTLRLGRLPWFIRRAAFWQALYLSGKWRARRFGTFMISSLGNRGVEQDHPITFQTTNLTLGPIDPTGRLTARITYDHRVTDGGTIARALGRIEDVMNGPILQELRDHLARGAEVRAA